MKVKELIRHLQAEDPELEVMIETFHLAWTRRLASVVSVIEEADMAWNESNDEWIVIDPDEPSALLQHLQGVDPDPEIEHILLLGGPQ